MAIYLCRWPNGDFSIVNARTKTDAVELLDEWGNAEQAFLMRMADCMFDFRLGDDGQIELASIGEATEDHIMEACYPVLREALAIAERDETGLDYSDAGRKQVQGAAELERTRLRDKQPPAKEAETALGRDIQKQTGAASVIVNRIVREAARKRLKSKEGDGMKPN
ncbi:MAG: hypothetical protein ABSH56_31185 [Bryobacteraceae bacterium]|jgi:hypothetical protein